MDEKDRKNEQDGDPHDEVTEVLDGFVEIGIGSGGPEALRYFPELGHRAGGPDDRRGRAGHDAGTHENNGVIGVAVGVLLQGEGFAGKGRLIDEEVFGGNELGVCGYDIACGKKNNVAGYEQGKTYFLARIVAQHGCGCRNAGGESGNRLFRAIGIAEIKHGRDDHHQKNDD